MSGELDYAVSKGAVHQMKPSFAHALIRHSIVLNTVNHPAPTRGNLPRPAARFRAWFVSRDGGHHVTLLLAWFDGAQRQGPFAGSAT